MTKLNHLFFLIIALSFSVNTFADSYSYNWYIVNETPGLLSGVVAAYNYDSNFPMIFKDLAIGASAYQPGEYHSDDRDYWAGTLIYNGKAYQFQKQCSVEKEDIDSRQPYVLYVKGNQYQLDSIEFAPPVSSNCTTNLNILSVPREPKEIKKAKK